MNGLFDVVGRVFVASLQLLVVPLVLMMQILNQPDGTLSVVDTQTLEKVADVRTGDRPVAVRYSGLSESV